MFYRTHLLLQNEPTDHAETRAGWTRDDVFRALDQCFTFTDEITRSFAADVFCRCVLPKIQPPVGLIKGRWMAPGGMSVCVFAMMTGWDDPSAGFRL